MSAGAPRKKMPPRLLATVSPSEPGLLSIAQAAERLGIAMRTAYEWAHADAMPGLVRINGRLYVKRAALERFLAGE